MDELGRAAEVTRAVRRAETLCISRSFAVTELRRQILTILAEQAGRPVGAYAILDAIARARGKAVGPPTVYRTLELLVDIGCVVKLESRNAFMLCDAPGHEHHGVMLICRQCGNADEVDSAEFDGLLHATAAASGFRLERAVVEIEGVCGHCAAA